MFRQHNEWVDGDDEARMGARAWRMHSLAIAAILEDPQTEERNLTANVHLEWGQILAETAWRWNMAESDDRRWLGIIRDPSNPLLLYPKLMTEDRLCKIQSALPWLIRDSFIRALLLGLRGWLQEWRKTGLRVRQN